MDMWFTLNVGEKEVSETGVVIEKPYVQRECFLVRTTSRASEVIKPSEGRELHRLLDVAIKQVNETLTMRRIEKELGGRPP